MLDGLNVSGDMDIAHSSAHIVGTLPTTPDLAGELIEVNGAAWTRLPGQARFQTATLTAFDPFMQQYGVMPLFMAVMNVAAEKSLTPKLLGVEEQQGGPAYHIQVQGSYAALAKLDFGGLLLTGPDLALATIDLWINTGTFFVSRVEVHANSTKPGAAVRLLITDYNDIAPIEPPAANNIQTPAPLSAPVSSPSY